MGYSDGAPTHQSIGCDLSSSACSFAYHLHTVMGAPYREVNSKVATTPKLKVEDKDRVNNSQRKKRVKLNIVKLEALLNYFSRGKFGCQRRMPNA